MGTAYQVSSGMYQEDFDTLAEAKAAVEGLGFGRVVKFINARSCAMQVFSDGIWRGVDISC